MCLDILQEFKSRLFFIETDADGDGSDHRSGHELDARNRGVAAGDYGAKADVISVTISAEDNSPCSTEDRRSCDGRLEAIREVDGMCLTTEDSLGRPTRYSHRRECSALCFVEFFSPVPNPGS